MVLQLLMQGLSRDIRIFLARIRGHQAAWAQLGMQSVLTSCTTVTGSTPGANNDVFSWLSRACLGKSSAFPIVALYSKAVFNLHQG